MAVVLALACAGPRPTPTLAPPTPQPTLGTNAAAEFGEEPEEFEDAFGAELRETTDEVQMLAGAPCDRLAEAIGEDPTLVDGLRGYAAALKSIAAQDKALAGPRTDHLLLRLEDALAELDETLASCNIRPS